MSDKTPVEVVRSAKTVETKTGKIIIAFDMTRVMTLVADWCNSARGFMFAPGCIQSSAATPTYVQ